MLFMDTDWEEDCKQTLTVEEDHEVYEIHENRTEPNLLLLIYKLYYLCWPRSNFLGFLNIIVEDIRSIEIKKFLIYTVLRDPIAGYRINRLCL